MTKSVVIGILALLATLWVGCTQSEPTSTPVPTPKLVTIPTRTPTPTPTATPTPIPTATPTPNSYTRAHGYARCRGNPAGGDDR